MVSFASFNLVEYSINRRISTLVQADTQLKLRRLKSAEDRRLTVSIVLP